MSSRPAESPRSRRRRDAAPVADLLVDVLKPAAKKRGFATVDLFTQWSEIVGAAYRDVTQPERLSWPRRMDDGGEDAFEPATLFVRCEGARALLFQHEIPQILERINTVFGFPAVGRIRISQKPISRPVVARAPRLRPLTRVEEARIEDLTAEIEDDGLRAALRRLGRAMVATPRR
ncbi:MAG: DciA family protein [Siculibacillus sp.]